MIDILSHYEPITLDEMSGIRGSPVKPCVE